MAPDEEYVGPAAIVNAHRFVYDSRDRGARQRLQILSERTGVFRCRTTFNCTEAWPRGIEVTASHERTVTLELRGHLVARGRVTAADGPTTACPA